MKTQAKKSVGQTKKNARLSYYSHTEGIYAAWDSETSGRSAGLRHVEVSDNV